MPVCLTAGEANWVGWALDPMADFWCTPDGARERGEDTVYPESDLPTIKGGWLSTSAVDDINADLLYRLQIQAPDVSDGAPTPQAVAGGTRTALSAAAKVRAMCPGIEPYM